MIAQAGAFGVFIFRFLERLLIPTGLHHVLNGIFRTTAIGGVYEGVEGCLNIFLQYVGKVDIAINHKINEPKPLFCAHSNI